MLSENVDHLAEASMYQFFSPWEIWMIFQVIIFKLILEIDGWGISCKIALKMALEHTNMESTLIQGKMAWCRQATSHYLSQYWPRSMSPYSVTRPRWVKWQLWSPWGILPGVLLQPMCVDVLFVWDHEAGQVQQILHHASLHWHVQHGIRVKAEKENIFISALAHWCQC